MVSEGANLKISWHSHVTSLANSFTALRSITSGSFPTTPLPLLVLLPICHLPLRTPSLPPPPPPPPLPHVPFLLQIRGAPFFLFCVSQRQILGWGFQELLGAGKGPFRFRSATPLLSGSSLPRFLNIQLLGSGELTQVDANVAVGAASLRQIYRDSGRSKFSKRVTWGRKDSTVVEIWRFEVCVGAGELRFAVP